MANPAPVSLVIVDYARHSSSVNPGPGSPMETFTTPLFFSDIYSRRALCEKEEVVRLKQADLDRLEMITQKRAAREAKTKDRFEVNVVCVRTVTEKGRVRSRMHEEFIIRTSQSHQSDVFVSRRYGDFKTLANKLQKAHPGESIPAPPPKDRTTVNLSTSISARSSPGFRPTPLGSPPVSASYSVPGGFYQN
ncbi:hypothetical protein FOMPIDRAFT_1055405 [Fomitopsis schrenkii]|uniref:PX domain-containing protein n=1 Tax=Fomitopsis schrenkii TaxID=2126942 RepID=S8EWW3_FOMSC|nr:hypothetical protein FOMPIDRAFT_1055405 [Fomitopsis schrenkii]